MWYLIEKYKLRERHTHLLYFIALQIHHTINYKTVSVIRFRKFTNYPIRTILKTLFKFNILL